MRSVQDPGQLSIPAYREDDTLHCPGEWQERSECKLIILQKKQLHQYGLSNRPITLWGWGSHGCKFVPQKYYDDENNQMFTYWYFCTPLFMFYLNKRQFNWCCSFRFSFFSFLFWSMISSEVWTFGSVQNKRQLYIRVVNLCITPWNSFLNGTTMVKSPKRDSHMVVLCKFTT